MVVSDPAIALEECEIPLAVPQPNHSTSNVFCRASSGPYPGSVYLINPVNNTWTLWVSGGLSGEYVVNWEPFSPRSAPRSKLQNCPIPRRRSRGSLNCCSRIATLLMFTRVVLPSP